MASISSQSTTASIDSVEEDTNIPKPMVALINENVCFLRKHPSSSPIESLKYNLPDQPLKVFYHDYDIGEENEIPQAGWMIVSSDTGEPVPVPAVEGGVQVVPEAELVEERIPTPDVRKPLRIIQYPTCYCAENYIRIHSKPLSISVLYSKYLVASTLYPSFKTGVSFSATPSVSLNTTHSATPEITLFISIPYVGRSSNEAGAGGGTSLRWRDSLSMFEYRFRDRDRTPASSIENRESMKQFCIQQAWFVVTEDENIAIFRPTDDTRGESGAQILSEYHKVEGAFHALPYVMLAILESSETSILAKLRDETLDHEHNAQFLTTGTTKPKPLVAKINQTVTTLTTLKGVLDSQIQILADLQEIFEKYNRSRDRKRHLKSNLVIKVFENSSEQVEKVLEVLLEIVKERESVRRTIEGLIGDAVRVGEFVFHFLASVNADDQLSIYQKHGKKSNEILEGTKNAIKGQKDILETTRDEIKAQGQAISVFTVVSVIAVPLGFFPSYFGMQSLDTNWVNKTKLLSEGDFWIYCGSFTGILGFVTLLFIVLANRYAQRATKHVDKWYHNLKKVGFSPC